MNPKMALSVAFCVFILAGCGDSNKGSIRLLSLSPDPTVALKVGQKVDLKLEVEYVLNKNEGYVGLYVHPEGGLPSIAVDVKDVKVKRGSGKAEVTGSFTVPDGPEVKVMTMLVAGSRTASTNVVASRTYNVIQKGK